MKAVATAGAFTIEIAGRELDSGDAACLSELSVRQALSLPTQCELAFRGTGEEFGDRASRFAGTSLAVRNEAGALFDGDVTAVEHAYTPDGGMEIRVRSYDALYRLRKRQPVEVRNDIDAAELCRQFARDLGLGAEMDESGPQWPRVAQWYQSDFDLFADLSRRSGLFFSIWDGTLRLFTLAGVGEPVPFRLGDELLEATFEVNGDRAWTEVATTGWDPGSGDRFRGSDRSARSGRSAEASVTTGDVGGESRRTLIGGAVPSLAHVEAEALGELDHAIANAITVHGVVSGSPALRPGCRILLEGVHQAAAGTYVVAEVIHTVDSERGFLSEFSTEVRPGLGGPAGTLVAPGVVDRVDDPAGQGRVTAKLPTYEDLETGWMRVVLPGAGPDKGFIALPDAGDEVLVLLPRGDPAAGIVLGGMFGRGDVQDPGVVDGRMQRQSWRSRHGHYVEIDDERRQITVTNANGNLVRLGDDRMTIHAATDLDISAPGRTITITAAAVDFRKG